MERKIIVCFRLLFRNNWLFRLLKLTVGYSGC